MDAKPKVQLAIQRFLSRGGGFFGSSPDKSLEDLGLQGLVPTHCTRTVLSGPMACMSEHSIVLDRKTSDFIFRYMCKMHACVTQDSKSQDVACKRTQYLLQPMMLQELSSQKHGSLGLLCDASPKAKMDVSGTALRVSHLNP